MRRFLSVTLPPLIGMRPPSLRPGRAHHPGRPRRASSGPWPRVGVAAAPPAGAANWAPVHAERLPRPEHPAMGRHVYYGFATQNFAAPSQTINIQVSTSLDGVNWNRSDGIDALPRVGSWAKAGDTWAPSVVSTTPTTTSSCTTRRRSPRPATSASAWPPRSSPTGPYTDNHAPAGRLRQRGRLQRPRSTTATTAAASTPTSSPTTPATPG